MMWLFAVLAVLAMGGIALVASGRGAPMAPAYDDRPDAEVPRDGELDAEDLRRVRFSLAFRGYRMSEVDALLDRLAREKEAAADRVVDHPPHHSIDGPIDGPIDRQGDLRGDPVPDAPESADD